MPFKQRRDCVDQPSSRDTCTLTYQFPYFCLRNALLKATGDLAGCSPDLETIPHAEVGFTEPGSALDDGVENWLQGPFRRTGDHAGVFHS